MEETISKALEWRYATKKFDSERKIRPTDLEVLKNALRKAPSSFGLQPWKFLIIEDEEVREKLKAAGWNQSQITDASHLFVLCAKKNINGKDISHYMDTISQTRKVPVENLKGFHDMIYDSIKNRSQNEIEDWNKRQVYIALGFLLETAALMEIDACPMEGFSTEEFDKILGLESEGYTSVVLCPVGYRSLDDSYSSLKKVRYSEKEVFEEI